MAPSGLPLQCYVCSKKPTFSDVSHLLTHVASKGHLSQYYKLKVKASRDASAQVIIDVYDRWYGDWSIEELMSERMASKEQKRRQSSNSARASIRPRPVASQSVDPSLHSSLPPYFGNQGYGNTASYLGSWHMPNPSDQGPVEYTPQLHLWSTSDINSYQAVPLAVPVAPMYQSCLHNSNNEAQLHDHEQDNDEDLAMGDADFESEAAKLKGVVWPGMDIFDSASQEVRRCRNQKKDGSVAQRLLRYSSEADAIEKIYDTTGDLTRERAITGRCDFPGSPLPGESPLFKGTNLLSRAPLKEVDSNAQRLKTRKTRRLQASKSSLCGKPDPLWRPESSPGSSKRTFNVLADDTMPSVAKSGFGLLTSAFNPYTKLEASVHGPEMSDEYFTQAFKPQSVFLDEDFQDCLQRAGQPFSLYAPAGVSLSQLLHHRPDFMAENTENHDTDEERRLADTLNTDLANHYLAASPFSNS